MFIVSKVRECARETEKHAIRNEQNLKYFFQSLVPVAYKNNPATRDNMIMAMPLCIAFVSQLSAAHGPSVF